jgi:hypothetical protein
MKKYHSTIDNHGMLKIKLVRYFMNKVDVFTIVGNEVNHYKNYIFSKIKMV